MRSGLLIKRNVFYLNIVAGVILFFAMILFVRDIISVHFQQRALKQENPFSTAVATPQTRKQLEDYSLVGKNNPFGFPGGEIKALTLASGGGTKTTDVVLVGTVVGPRELSYAIFKDNTGMQEVFKIGEPVFGAGKLHAVKRDKAVLRRGQVTMEVPLEDVTVKEISRRGSGVSLSSPAFAQKIGRDNYLVDQAKVQQMIMNPGQMMTDARLRPNIADGKEEGFVLSEVKPGGIYQSLGLQNGDVLLRINDYDISNPERALQAFTALRGMDRVQIDLIRAGSKMTMTYQIK